LLTSIAGPQGADGRHNGLPEDNRVIIEPAYGVLAERRSSSMAAQ